MLVKDNDHLLGGGGGGELLGSGGGGPLLLSTATLQGALKPSSPASSPLLMVSASWGLPTPETLLAPKVQAVGLFPPKLSARGRWRRI